MYSAKSDYQNGKMWMTSDVWSLRRRRKVGRMALGGSEGDPGESHDWKDYVSPKSFRSAEAYGQQRMEGD
jgi:hypothetical protein